ncbi:MAG TPA: 3-dehydroquinate synthase family protein [Haloplasmataceae bacterium]
MRKVTLNIPNNEINIYIGDCLSLIKDFIDIKQKILVITDENVCRLHLDELKKVINIDYLFILSSKPENNKTLDTYEKCIDYALKNCINRNTTVIAFGGGAVSDFTGFFASTYKRGMKLINIPTTLLAHDSAIGGKNGLNFANYKNIIGTFYQPQVILYHLPFLKTLPNNEILSGFGEIIKHDLLADGYLLHEVLDSNKPLLEYFADLEVIEEIVYRAILVKKLYIEMDIYDLLGRRQFLNFGHTLGHALEVSYSLSHGEAISFGMCFDLFLANNPLYKELYKALKKWGYFNKIDFKLDDVISLIKNDKKKTSAKIKFIGLKEIGNPYEINISIEEFKVKYLEYMRSINEISW